MLNLKKSSNKKIKEPFSVFNIVFFIFITIYSASLLFLLGWGLLSSVRDKIDFQFFPLKFPTEFHFENFIKAFDELQVPVGGYEVYLPEMFLWTIVYSVGVCTVAQLSRCVCAYVCARFSKYRITKIMYNIVIIVMILPIVGNQAAAMATHRLFGSYDNIFMYILTSAGFTGQYFLIYYASFKGVSMSYAEAASIDGANHFVVFFKIMLPLVVNIMGALFLLEFIGLWNDYTAVVMYLPSYPTVSYGLYTFSVSGGQGETTIRMAASMLVAVPIIILYIIFNKQLLGRVSIGGLKG